MLRFLSLLVSVVLISGTVAPVYAGSPESGASSSGDIDLDLSQWDEYPKNISTTPDPAMLERARKAIPGNLDRRVEGYKEELRKGAFSGAEEVIEYNRGVMGMEEGDGKGQSGGSVLGDGEKISILISSSVPIHALRNYARDLDALREPGIVMVMRGFIDGMVKAGPTLTFVNRIVMKDEGCEGRDCEAYGASVAIDPQVFREYGVEEAPAVVYETIGGDSYLLYGDSSIEGALEMINRRAKSESVNCLIMKLRRGPGYTCLTSDGYN